MSEKELTYVLEEEPKGSEIVGYITVPREISDLGICCLPITAAAYARIERRALQAETKAEVERLRVKLLANGLADLIEAFSNRSPINHDYRDI